jgi:hypothetical protein
MVMMAAEILEETMVMMAAEILEETKEKNNKTNDFLLRACSSL